MCLALIDIAELRARMRRLGATCTAVKPQSICMIGPLLLNTHIWGSRVGPRHGANSGGGNEPRFRPAGEVKNIVYQNRGVFDKYYLLYGLARVVYVIALTTGRRALQGFGPADMCVTPDGRHQSSNLVRTCVTSFSFLAPTPSLAVRWSSMDADGQ